MPGLADTQLALIPGGHASSVGGYVSITDPYADPEETILDVGRWELEERFVEQSLMMGGSLGAVDSRRTGYSYAFALQLLFDLRKPPNVKLRAIDGIQIGLWFGDLLSPTSSRRTERWRTLLLAARRQTRQRETRARRPG